MSHDVGLYPRASDRRLDPALSAGYAPDGQIERHGPVSAGHESAIGGRVGHNRRCSASRVLDGEVYPYVRFQGTTLRRVTREPPS